MTETLTLDQLVAACAYWQKELRLQDWDVRVTISRASAFETPKREGEINMTWSRRLATLLILDPADFPVDHMWSQDMEETLVHELLHLHMRPFWAEADTAEDTAQEQMINALAQALVRLKRQANIPMPGSSHVHDLTPIPELSHSQQGKMNGRT